ncbi:MAG: hypothetical protein VXW32_11735 [Myxococcota bacterium]|nr:hypothetical protein [Myxococcota bacterium]
MAPSGPTEQSGTKTALAVLVCLTGCYNTDRVCSEAADYEASVELGAWSNGGFSSLEDGDAVAPTFGPQGGEHLAASVRASGVNPGNGEMKEDSGGLLGIFFPTTGAATVATGRDPVNLTFRVHYEEGLLESSEVVFETFLQGDVESAVSLEQTVFMNSWQLSEAYPDEEFINATMRVKLVDACGTAVEDVREIRIVNTQNDI